MIIFSLEGEQTKRAVFQPTTYIPMFLFCCNFLHRNHNFSMAIEGMSFSSVSGQFDNIFWHGVPEKFCLRTVDRIDNKTTEACEIRKLAECDECATFDPVHSLPTFSCINPGRHGHQGKKVEGLCPERFKFKQLQILNNVSRFFCDMYFSTEAHFTTPYFTAVFARNNYGSWVDIVVETKTTDANETGHITMDIGHQYETPDINNHVDFAHVYSNIPFLLWFHLNRSDTAELTFSLKLESQFELANILDINSIAWEGQVRLTTEKPVFCISTPGLISGGMASLESTDHPNVHSKPFKGSNLSSIKTGI